MEWGDLSFKTEPCGDFTGVCAGKGLDLSEKVSREKRSYKSVDSRDIKLFYLQK